MRMRVTSTTEITKEFMFSRLFGRPKEVPRKVEASKTAPAAPAAPADSMIAARLAGKAVLAGVMTALKNDRGVHVESLFCALGALAGYACQANLREQAIARGMDPNAPFLVAKATDGKSYYLGDPLNTVLAEGKFSVWSLAAGAAQHNGAKTLPDIHEMFRRTAANIGSASFGVPEDVEGHRAGELPAAYLRRLWPAMLPIVKKRAADPVLWPLVYAFAIQDAIDMTPSAIPPHVALAIVMESAIPMSKVDLSSL